MTRSSTKHGAWIDVDGTRFKVSSMSCVFYDRVGVGKSGISATLELSRSTIKDIAEEAHRRLVPVSAIYEDENGDKRVLARGIIDRVSLGVRDSEKTIAIEATDIVSTLLGAYQLLFVKPDTLIQSFSSPQSTNIYGSFSLDPISEIITRGIAGSLNNISQFIDALLGPVLEGDNVLSETLGSVTKSLDLRSKIREALTSSSSPILEAARTDLLIQVIKSGGVTHGAATTALSLLDEFLRTVIYKLSPIPAYDGGFIALPDYFLLIPPPCNKIHKTQGDIEVSIETSNRVTRTIGIVPFNQILGNGAQGGGISDYALLPAYEPSPSISSVGAQGIVDYFQKTLGIETRMLPSVDFENMPRWVMFLKSTSGLAGNDLRQLSKYYVEWSHARKFLMRRSATFNNMGFIPDLANGFTVDFTVDDSTGFKNLDESKFYRIWGTINHIMHSYSSSQGWNTSAGVVGVKFDDSIEEDVENLPAPISSVAAAMRDPDSAREIYESLGLVEGRSGVKNG